MIVSILDDLRVSYLDSIQVEVSLEFCDNKRRTFCFPNGLRPTQGKINRCDE